MLLETKKKELNIIEYPNGMDKHIILDTRRAENLATVKAIYENEVKDISFNTLFKVAVDTLINTIEDLTEEEAIRFLTKQYKEALF